MKILRAEHLGMCFGVRDAVALALQEAATQPLTVLGDLVHNETVLARLQTAGIRFQNEVGLVATARVMITAHGASDRKLAEARQRGLHVIEATCPLVHLAHRSLKMLVSEGFYPIIIGKRDHVEVRGMTEDLAQFDVVLDESEMVDLEERQRFGVVVQALRERFPKSEVRFIDTVCQPTKQRQHAATGLARQCDVVVVVGGAHSNNTHELVKSCSQFCACVHHVQTADDLLPNWFNADDTVGITAGTSTPDYVIAEVEQRLGELAAANSLTAKAKAAMKKMAAPARVSMKQAEYHAAKAQLVK